MGNFSKTAVVAGLLLIACTSKGAAEWSPQDDPPSDEQYAGQDPHWVMDEATECWAYNAHAGANDNVTWSGDCRDGKLSGPGTLTYFNQGRMFERVTGEFSEGILQDGHVSIAWNDGSKYDGDEQNGQFNGYGTLVASDGTRYQGLWKDDKFEGGRSSDSTTDAKPAVSNDSGSTAQGQRTAQPESGRSTEKPAPGNKTQKIYPVQWTLFGKALGNELVAADGSRLLLKRTEAGSLRQTIVHPEGAWLSLVLVPLSERLGTVQDKSGKVIATFRLRDGALTVAFDDGRTETIAPHTSEGVKTVLQRPSAPSLTTDWYPEGHVFSRAERETTARQPPSRLAIVLAAANTEKGPPAVVPAKDPAPVLPARGLAEEREPTNSRHSHAIAAAQAAVAAPMTKPVAFASAWPHPRKPQQIPLRRHIEEARKSSKAPALRSSAAQPPTATAEQVSTPAAASLQRHLVLASRRHLEKNRLKIASSIQTLAPDAALLQTRSALLPPSLLNSMRQKHRLASAGKPKSDSKRGTSALRASASALATVLSRPIEPPSAAISTVPQQHLALLSKSKREKQRDTTANSMTPPATMQAQSTRTQTPSAPTNPTAQQHLALMSKPADKHDVPLPSALTPPPITIQAQIPRIQALSVPTIVAPIAKRPFEERHNAPVATIQPASPVAAVRPQTPVTPPVPAPPNSVSQQHLALVRPPEEQQHESIPAPNQPSSSVTSQSQAATSQLPPISVMSPPQLAQTPRHPSEDKRDTLTATAAPAAAPPSPPPFVQVQASESLAAPASLIHTLGPPVVPRRSASNCLTVESDGMHWGFRNHCPADIQFSYCLLNSPDRLTACSGGSVAGSVAGNGFSALVADSSIKDPGASRAFRWVGCVGGAGEVRPRLDRVDPPMGRCLHSGDVPQGIERADVALHKR